MTDDEDQAYETTLTNTHTHTYIYIWVCVDFHQAGGICPSKNRNQAACKELFLIMIDWS